MNRSLNFTDRSIEQKFHLIKKGRARLLAKITMSLGFCLNLTIVMNILCQSKKIAMQERICAQPPYIYNTMLIMITLIMC